MPTSGRASEISTTSQSMDDDNDEDDDDRYREKRRRRSVSKKGNKRRSSGGGGKDGKGERKLITPPPIIGPDGKELPRPTDPEGRPLPIYVDEDKKPMLDGQGKPIAVRFQKDGKPIPYEKFLELVAKGEGGKRSRTAVAGANNDTSSQAKVPRCCLWVGVLDFIISLILLIYYAWLTSADSGSKIAQLAVTDALFVIALLADILSYFAVKKNKQMFLWIWCTVAIVLLIGQISASATLDEQFVKNSIFGAVLYCFFRIALIGSTVCCIAITDDSSAGGGNQRYVVASGSYPRGTGGGGPQTIVVQQPRVYPGYGYGYGYGGPSYGEAALLGLAAGSMMGGYHHYYDPYWGGGWGGYGGWGYDGWGYDDYGYF